MKNTKTREPEQLHAVDLVDVPALLDPAYLPPYGFTAARLKREGLLQWNDAREEMERTQDGRARVTAIRADHAIELETDDGGPRWFLQNEAIHCGDAFKVLRRSGDWITLRWEIAWHKPDADLWDAGGRSPRFYLSVAGTGSLMIVPSPEDLGNGIYRWPEGRA